MASGQEVTSTPGRRMHATQRMPRSCSMMLSTDMPERRAMETKRLVASDWEAQPPPLPVLVKTSHIPCSSELTLMYRFPQPILTFSVLPVVITGRGRGRCRLLRRSAPNLR